MLCKFNRLACQCFAQKILNGQITSSKGERAVAGVWQCKEILNGQIRSSKEERECVVAEWDVEAGDIGVRYKQFICIGSRESVGDHA